MDGAPAEPSPDDGANGQAMLPFGPYAGEPVSVVAIKDPDYLDDLVREGVGPAQLRAEAAKVLARRDRWSRRRPLSISFTPTWVHEPELRRRLTQAAVGALLLASALVFGRCADRGLQGHGGGTFTRSGIESSAGASGSPAAIAALDIGAPGTATPQRFDRPATTSSIAGSRAITSTASPDGTAGLDPGGPPCGARVPGTVPAESAADHLDTYAAVEFHVVRTKDTGRVTFLNSHDPYEGYFYVAVFPSDYDRFPDHPARLFEGRCIVVQGTIETYRGSPQIVIRDPADVRIVGD